MTAFLAAHPGLALAAVIAAAAALAAVALAVILYATRDLGTRSSRPASRGPACRAREQRARAGKARAIFPLARAAALAAAGWALHTAARRWRALRTWWAFTRRRFERPLSPDDRITLGVIGQMHEDDTGGLIALPAPGTTVKLAPADRRAAIRTIHHEPASGFLAAPTNGPAAALPPPPAVAAAGHPGPGREVRLGKDAGTPAPAAVATCPPAGDQPGPEGAESPAAPSPAPAALTMAAVDRRAAEIAAVRAAPIATYLGELDRATAYAHSDETDSFAAIAAGWGA